MEKLKEKCEMCGGKAVTQEACSPCKKIHSLCESCKNLCQYTYANETGPCFLKGKYEKK